MTNEEINSMFQEVLEAINDSSTRLEERIEEKIGKEINGLRQEMNQRFIESEKRIDQHFDWIENNMATKSQMYRLTNVLCDRKIISKLDAHYVMNDETLS